MLKKSAISHLVAAQVSLDRAKKGDDKSKSILHFRNQICFSAVWDF